MNQIKSLPAMLVSNLNAVSSASCSQFQILHSPRSICWYQHLMKVSVCFQDGALINTFSVVEGCYTLAWMKGKKGMNFIHPKGTESHSQERNP